MFNRIFRFLSVVGLFLNFQICFCEIDLSNIELKILTLDQLSRVDSNQPGSYVEPGVDSMVQQSYKKIVYSALYKSIYANLIDEEFIDKYIFGINQSVPSYLSKPGSVLKGVYLIFSKTNPSKLKGMLLALSELDSKDNSYSIDWFVPLVLDNSYDHFLSGVSSFLIPEKHFEFVDPSDSLKYRLERNLSIQDFLEFSHSHPSFVFIRPQKLVNVSVVRFDTHSNKNVLENTKLSIRLTSGVNEWFSDYKVKFIDMNESTLSSRELLALKVAILSSLIKAHGEILSLSFKEIETMIEGALKYKNFLAGKFAQNPNKGKADFAVLQEYYLSSNDDCSNLFSILEGSGD